MNIVPFLVRKYLRSGKTSLSINIIASITILGLAIGTAALIIVLSVFNGFEELVSGMFSKYNPDIKIVRVDGRPFHEDRALLREISLVPEIKILSRVYEQNCMFQHNNVQDFGTLKGVDQNFPSMISLDSAIVEGALLKNTKGRKFAYLGLGMSNKLGVSLEQFYSEITAVTPGFQEGKIELKEQNFKKFAIQPQMIYALKQESDDEVILTDLDEFRKYLGDTTILSSIQIKLTDPKFSSSVLKKLTALAGPDFKVKDRYLQDEAFLKIMNLEKWLFFTLFMFTLILVSFTIVGTLWMMVIEKRHDISILKSLGMEDIQIQKVYLGLGIGIGIIGIILGFAISLFFYYMQKEYAWIKVPADFVVDSYPISIRFKDFIIVAVTVLSIVILASILPARKINEVDLIFKED
ncbi:MAG: ABC transporter permease [Saprospiraceae bacterium]|nr:ABC transporter permease [Saprospiraceae bacterium]